MKSDPVTEEQFKQIESFVTGRLASERVFEIHAQTFCELFKLKPLFYRELCRRVKDPAVPFVLEGKWRDDSGEPTELQFSRIEG